MRLFVTVIFILYIVNSVLTLKKFSEKQKNALPEFLNFLLSLAFAVWAGVLIL